MSRNHYDALSIPRDASAAHIRSSYLELARRFHPDRVPLEQRSQATLIFQQLAESYRVLSDPQLRVAYDRTIDRNSGSIGAKTNQEHVASSTSFANPVSSTSKSCTHRPLSPSHSHHQVILTSKPPVSSRRPPSASNYGSSSIPFPPPGAYPQRYPFMNDSRYHARPQSSSSNTPRFSSAPTFARFTSPSSAPPTSLESIDPFSLFDEVLAEQKESRDPRTGFDGMERMLFTGGSERDWRVGQDCPTFEETQRSLGRPRKMSASWNEGERRKNGEWNMRTGSQYLEESADGTIKFSSSSIKISSGDSGFMPERHPSHFADYHSRSNPPLSLPTPRPRRPPSPSFILAATPPQTLHRSRAQTTPARPPSPVHSSSATLTSGQRQLVATNQRQLATVPTRPKSPALVPIPSSSNSVLVGSAARVSNRGNGVASSAESRGRGSTRRILFDR